MADLTAPRPINALMGIAGNAVLSPTLGPINSVSGGITAATLIWSGAICAYDANGNILNADTVGAVTVVGIAKSTYNNTTTAQGGFPATSGLAAAITGTVLSGPYSCLGDGSITASTPYGTDLFVVDNQTLSTGDSGGTRLRAGYFVALDSNSNPVCMFGVASPTARNFSGTSGFNTPPYKARAVITALSGAYTGSTTNTLTASANAAFGTQDGVANLAVNDVVIMPEGVTSQTALSDSGPWVITALGSGAAKWTLQRPDWWATGSVLPAAATIDVSEGTQWAGIPWRAFAVKGSAVVDTNDPVLWPREWTKSVTLVTGFATVLGLPIRSLTLSSISFQATNFNGAGSTVSYRTGAYASGGAATVVGVVGTGAGATQASVSITALIAAGTFNTSDIGTGLLSVANW